MLTMIMFVNVRLMTVCMSMLMIMAVCMIVVMIVVVIMAVFMFSWLEDFRALLIVAASAGSAHNKNLNDKA
jgi:hypothetical protein